MKLSYHTYILGAVFSFATTASAAPAPVQSNGDSSRRSLAQSNGRRTGPLGGASPGASSADCARPVRIKLYADSPSTTTFRPDPRACRSGRTFAGASDDGRSHITLVPGVSNNGNSDSNFAASVTDDETGAVYSIAPDADGEMIVVERMQEDYGDELDPLDDDDEGEGEDADGRALVESRSVSGPATAAGSRLRGGRSAGASTSALAGQFKDLGDRFLEDSPKEGHSHSRSLQTNDVMDVLVVWTTNAECRNSGLATGCTRSSATADSIRSRIDLAVSETNVAYAESGVNADLNLIEARWINYQEAGSEAFSTALSALRSTTDGIMDEVHQLRTTFGADLVALIIDDAQYCGIAYLGPSITNMFSVTAWNCATGYYSFGHEIGHNLGCNHDKGTSNACANTSYNYGWRDPNANFRSILAYNCASGQCDNNSGGGCTRVQRFSNPNFLYNNAAMGSAQHDNARRINDVSATVAGYYDSCPGCTLSPTGSPTNECSVDADCDDLNACNGLETCVLGQCQDGTPETGCCGNDVCEAGEEGTCAVDCSKELVTTWIDNNGSQGNVFKIAVVQDMFITGFTIHAAAIATGQVRVWTRPGDYAGFENNSAGWTSLQDTTVTASVSAGPEGGTGYKVALPLDPPLALSAGTTHSFMILTTAPLAIRYTNGGVEGNMFAENAGEISFYEGRGCGGEFSCTFVPRVWNGIITYALDNGTPEPTESPITLPPTTMSPTNAPTTRSPSKSPTPPPTMSPTPEPTNSPTDAPITPVPTTSPTPLPTDAPSKPPTDSPVPAPTTTAPSGSPSRSPTNKPTNSPTDTPTDAPTPQPTDAPTVPPTDSPTDVPTNPPTNPPTNSPTLPKDGWCSDGTGRCSENDLSDCICASGDQNPFERKLKGQTGSAQTKMVRRKLPKKTPQPTQPATPPPTLSPVTSQPTKAPMTQPPTKNPTPQPTDSPTMPVACECLATAFPTNAPTNDPTNAPTPSPSSAPTDPPVSACLVKNAICDPANPDECCNGQCNTKGQAFKCN